MLKTNDTLQCHLVLYYYMDGSGAVALSVGYRAEQKDQVVLKLQGQRGPLWIRDRISFTHTASSFQIFIEGSGGGVAGSVTVDDLILSPGCEVQSGSPGSIMSSPRQDDAMTRSEREACQVAPAIYDFESSEGGWTDISIGASKWGQSTKASYLTVLKAGGNVKTDAHARSPLLCPTGPSCVLNMTYYLHTGPAGFLALYWWDPQLQTHAHVWQSRGERSDAWKSVLIALGERTQDFQLVLAGVVDPGPSENWTAAVSRIEFLDCGKESAASKEPVTCNFETGLCGWYQDVTEEMDWTLGTLSDHTTGQGHYMFVAGESRSDRGTKARLVSYPQTTTAETSCLSFHHRMFGPDTGTLNLFSKYDGGEETLLWTSTGTRGNRWHRESVTLTNKKYQLIFEAVRDGSVGHIAIDDITVMGGACEPPSRCSFEAGACGFSSEGQYKWSLHQNIQFTRQTGPPHDHTLQSFTGHYMAVDTSSTYLPRKASALLTSSVYSARPEGCLSFWYWMEGTDPGTLIVFIEADNGKKKVTTEILRIAEGAPGSWRHGSATLRAQTQWKLLFEAVGAGGERAYIAVDDIHIRHHPCQDSVSCDFERDSCSWTNVRIPLMDTYDWDSTYGASIHRARSAPEKDHSRGSAEGHYAFVDTGAMHAEGTSAWLISEHLSATAGSCFTFAYRTDSADHFHLGELVVYVTGAQGLLPVWGLRGYHSDTWREEQLQLNSTGDFQIVFEATKGRRPHAAIISLDSLTYTPDTLCNAQDTHKPKGKDNSGRSWAIAIGVIVALLCLLLIFMLYRRWRRNLQSDPPLPEQADQIDGFDNVSYDIDSSS